LYFSPEVRRQHRLYRLDHERHALGAQPSFAEIESVREIIQLTN